MTDIERPADTMRRAAKLMRERAAAATPGLWQHMCMGSDGCLVLRRNATIRERARGRVAKFWLKDWKADHADAEYVAAMAPPVALALAAWLDMEASSAPEIGEMTFCGGRSVHALAVACAYLGHPAFLGELT